MRVKASQSLLFLRERDEVVAFNFLTGASFSCSPDLLSLLVHLDEWTAVEDVGRYVPGLCGEELRAAIADLLDVDALVREGSPAASADDDLRANWRWGVPAAAFHFSLRDRAVMSIEDAERVQQDRVAEVAQPPLYFEAPLGESIALPESLAGNDLLGLMARRRTVRTFAPRPVALQALSDCLFAGMGIVGSTKNCVGTLPLSMTPSGGARNPYEAYVLARAVDGLQPGVYHYAAIDHSLTRLDTDSIPDLPELLGGQEWTADAPAVIFLCAEFERTMWKYDDANAYRVVLIEAGHIAQNVMLAATRHGLTACPTAALYHSRIDALIGADKSLTHAPIYALALAVPQGGLDSAKPAEITIRTGTRREPAVSANPVNHEFGTAAAGHRQKVAVS